MHKNKKLMMVEPLKTGELLAKEGLIRHDDIYLALSIQEKRQESPSLRKSRFLGTILCDLNLITPMDNYHVLHKYNKLYSIQSGIIAEKILSRQGVERFENEAQRQSLPFISLVLEKGIVSTTGMQKLLFDLFHIPFRSISDFSFNQKDIKDLVMVLDKEKSWANSIIPLVLKDNTILFGITDPDNLLFIRDLNNRFPQYRFKALFVFFSEFAQFYEILYQTHKNTEISKEEPLDLSLLLNFKISIQDPEKENKSIQTLYERYELLRHLIGNPKRDNFQDEFTEFVLHTHRQITKEYKDHSIEFSLKKQGRDVKIIAFPKMR